MRRRGDCRQEYDRHGSDRLRGRRAEAIGHVMALIATAFRGIAILVMASHVAVRHLHHRRRGRLGNRFGQGSGGRKALNGQQQAAEQNDYRSPPFHVNQNARNAYRAQVVGRLTLIPGVILNPGLGFKVKSWASCGVDSYLSRCGALPRHQRKRTVETCSGRALLRSFPLVFRGRIRLRGRRTHRLSTYRHEPLPSCRGFRERPALRSQSARLRDSGDADDVVPTIPERARKRQPTDPDQGLP